MRRCFLICSAAGVVFLGAAFGEFVYQGEWGSFGTGPGQFNQPFGITVRPDGLVYVTDFLNHRVQYFTAEGRYLGRWGSYGHEVGNFARPWGVAFYGGRVYVTENSNHRVQYFRESEAAVEPCSLGRVRALFK